MSISYRVKGDYSAALIGTVLTTDRAKIKQAIVDDVPLTLITTKELKFMANCDLGKQWQHLANAPVFLKYEPTYIAISA